MLPDPPLPGPCLPWSLSVLEPSPGISYVKTHGLHASISPEHSQEHRGAAAEDRMLVLQLLTAGRTDPSNSILRSHLPDLVWLFTKLQSFCTPLRCTPHDCGTACREHAPT